MERELRENVVTRFKTAILELWPNATVEVFGSFRTELYLPKSDVDLIIFGVEDQSRFFMLRDKLLADGIIEPHLIEIVRARVPIIKCMDLKSKFSLDISFGKQTLTNIQLAELIIEYKRRYPSLPKLVAILKQFMQQHKLNKPYTGNLTFKLLLAIIVNC